METFRRKLKEYSIELVLIVLIIFFSIQRPQTFSTFSNAITILRQSAILGIISIGMVFVVVAGGIDLAVGSMISVVNVLCAILLTSYEVPWWLTYLIGIGFSTIIGTIIGLVIVKTKIWPMIGTLALQQILSGIAFIICRGMPINNLPKEALLFGQGNIGGMIPVSVILFLIIAGIAGFVLNRTYFGRYVYAVGSNKEAARLSGINVNRISVITYTISGFMCGVAGMIMTGRISSGQPKAGDGYEMNCLTAVVLGGISLAGGEGKIAKATCGVLILGVLMNGMTILDVSEYTQRIIEGIILLLAICFDSMSSKK